MRILITGGCGFIGAGFVRQICKNYPSAVVINIDCLSPCSTKAIDLTESSGNYYFVHGDIKDTLLVQNTIRTYKPDTVVHFAAQSHVDTSFTDPISYTNDNVLGTHVLLEACRLIGGIKRFIHISTDEVYGENGSDNSVKTEESLLKPTNPYAATKAAAEMLVHSYMHSYQFPAVIIRSNNVYGPGQYFEKVIPKFIQQLLADNKITIQGSGHQLRSFLYLDDAVAAIECVMFQGHVGSIYNISSDHEISVLDLAKTLLTKIHGVDAVFENWITHIEDRNFNDSRYWIKSEPLAKLGWSQKVNFEDGLMRTIEWYRQVDNTYWSETQMKTCRKVLVYGGRGWIGGIFETELRKQGWKVCHAVSRADNRDAVEAEISAVEPSHLLSLIGRTHGPGFSTIDYLEQPGKLQEYIRDNLYGPLVLAEAARKTKKHLLYMGTGCIFTGLEHELFTEDSKPNFFGSAYSTVKGFTDQLMAAYPGVLNVRIRMPIYSQDNPRNFITKIIQYQKINSIPNSMTVLDDIIPLLVKAMEDQVVGTLNAVNPGLISHSEILRTYRDIQNPTHTWKELDTAELMSGGHVVAARSNNHLDTTRIKSLYPMLPSISESVERILRENKFKGR